MTFTAKCLCLYLGKLFIEGIALGLRKLDLFLSRLAGAIQTLDVWSVHLRLKALMRPRLTAKVPAPQADPPRTSLISPKIWKAGL